jgi:hypothetical protein
VVVEAARAWLQVFVGGYKELPASDEGTWLVTRELTFPLFVLTRCMRCKAASPWAPVWL